MRWTRRKRSAVERAAGIGADAAAAAAHRQSTAVGDMQQQAAQVDDSLHSRSPAASTAAAAEAVADRTSDAQPQQASRPQRQSQLPIGAFQRLPQVQVAAEQLSSALRKAQKLANSKTIKNEAAKARNRWVRGAGGISRAALALVRHKIAVQSRCQVFIRLTGHAALT